MYERTCFGYMCTKNVQNRWLRLNMTEKLFTGTLNKNQKKKKKCAEQPMNPRSMYDPNSFCSLT